MIDAALLAEILGFSVGYLWGEAFSKTDWAVQQTAKFKALGPGWKWLVENILNMTHHFQYGLGAMLLALKFLLPGTLSFTLLYVGGAGMVLSDIKDLQNILRRLQEFQLPVVVPKL